jgi:colicin import membrane protein
VSQKYTTALILSLALHLSIVLVLAFGDITSETKPQPKNIVIDAKVIKPIDAVAINKQKLQQQINKIIQEKAQQRRAEEKRIKDLEQRAIKAKKSRQQEQNRIKNLERQRQQKLKEKQQADKRASDAKAKAALAEKIRKKKEAEKKKAEQAAAEALKKKQQAEDAAKKAKALREKQEAARKRKIQEAKERAAQQQMLEQQMAEEMASRQRARRKQMMSEINRYTALITQTIQRNLITDRSTMEGKSCKLTISLAPSGFVTNVVLGQGNRTVCDAAQKAIYKAGTLPVSKDPEVFKEMRTISLTVVPDFN